MLDSSTGLIAVIEAPSGLPWPTVEAAIAFCRECREVTKIVVASDQPIQAQSNEAGAYFFVAPSGSMAAETPRFALLSAVAEWCERQDGERVRLIFNIDPTKPMNDPLTVYECFQRILVNAFADGVLGVTRGSGLTEKDGWLETDGSGALSHDPSIRLFRRAFVDEPPAHWLAEGKFISYDTAPYGQGPRGALL